jgi:hypothetical protein
MTDITVKTKSKVTYLSSERRLQILEDCNGNINQETGKTNNLFLKELSEKYGITRRTAARYCEKYRENNNIPRPSGTPRKSRKKTYVSNGNALGRQAVISKPTVRETCNIIGNICSKYYWRITPAFLSFALSERNITMSESTARNFLYKESHAKVCNMGFVREKKRRCLWVYNEDLCTGRDSMLHNMFHPDATTLKWSGRQIVLWEGVNPPSDAADPFYKYEELKHGKIYFTKEENDEFFRHRFYPVVKSEEIVCKCGNCLTLKQIIKRRRKRDLEEAEERRIFEEKEKWKEKEKKVRSEETRESYRQWKLDNAAAIALYAEANQKRHDEKEVRDYTISLKKIRERVDDRVFEASIRNINMKYNRDEGVSGDGLKCLGLESEDESEDCDDNEVRSVDEDEENGVKNICGLINDVEEESCGEELAYWQVQFDEKQ